MPGVWNRSLRRIALCGLVGVLTALPVSVGSAGRSPGPRPAGTLAFASDRSGDVEIYSIRADGSRLGQLTRMSGADTAPLFSPDGRLVLFFHASPRSPRELWVMHADGSGRRRLAADALDPVWSPNSRRIAYTVGFEGPLVLVGVDGGDRRVVPGKSSRPSWSPDGRAVAFLRGRSGERLNLMVVGRNGRGLRTVRRNLNYGAPLAFGWSPSGEITFFTWEGGGALLVVGADGRRARRLLRASVFGLAWAPDGRRFAFLTLAGGRVRLRVASADGRKVRDITPRGAGSVVSPAWSPDGHWLALRRRPADAVHYELMVVAADGSSARTITKRIPFPWGSETGAPSWRPRSPASGRLGRAPVAPLPSELATRTAFRAPARGVVQGLAADGGRAAIVVGFGACASVEVWEAARARVVRLQRPCGPSDEVSNREGTPEVALAGTRVAWVKTGGGNLLETVVATATLARPTPVAIALESADDSGAGSMAGHLAGDSALLAFTVDEHCDPDGTVNGRPERQCPPGRRAGAVLAAEVWRIGGRGRCPYGTAGSTGCTRVAAARGEMSVLDVDAGRIAVRTDTGLRLLTADGAVVRDFSVSATAAALSGTRLAVRTAGAVEVFDTRSGERLASVPAARDVRLADLQDDILVTVSDDTVLLRRLSDERTISLRTAAAARTELESSGLFVAAGSRVMFTPMSALQRRFG